VSPPSQAPLFSFRTLVSALLSPFPSEGVKYEVACDRNEVAAPQVTAGRPAFLLRFSCHVCASLFRGGSRTSDLSRMAHHHRRRVAELFVAATARYRSAVFHGRLLQRFSRASSRSAELYLADDKFSGNLLPRAPGSLPYKRRSFVREFSRILRLYIRESSTPFLQTFPTGRSISYDSFLRNRARVADPDEARRKYQCFFFFPL